MPISAPGANSGHAMKPGQRGFTLIEIMVVMVILAIMMTLVSVNFSQDNGRVLNDEASRLATLLEHAQNEAMITGKPVAWSGTTGKYQFWQLGSDKKWDKPSGDETLRERTFPIAIEFAEIKVAGTPIKLGERLIFLAGGLNQPFDITLRYDEKLLTIHGGATGRVSVGEKA